MMEEERVIIFHEIPIVGRAIRMSIDGRELTSSVLRQVQELPDGTYRVKTDSGNLFVGRYIKWQEETVLINEQTVQTTPPPPPPPNPPQQQTPVQPAMTPAAQSNLSCVNVIVGVFIFIVFSAFLAVVFDGPASDSTGSDTGSGGYSTPVPERNPADDLVLGDWGWEDGYIVGTIKNNGGTRFKYVEVNFSLYDANGAQVGDAMTNVLNLDPYGTWRFKAGVLEDNVSNAKFVNIEATPE